MHVHRFFNFVIMKAFGKRKVSYVSVVSGVWASACLRPATTRGGPVREDPEEEATMPSKVLKQ